MAIEPSGTDSAHEIAICLDRGCLLRGEREIRLRAKTFQVLVYLHQHHGRLVTKDNLFRAVWPDTFVSDDSLTKCIGEIREAIGDGDHQLLKTVPRRGFILDAPVATRGQAGDAHRQSGRDPSERLTHNLPAPLNSFIGRQQQIAELTVLLPFTRLLTLTGTGGCGKTRLALEVAGRLRDRFPDGVWLADLAPLGEPALVAQTVASILDVRQSPNRSLVESLADQLRHRRMLLLLDNCEHVIAGAAAIADTLLGASAGLAILATSREALRIPGERTWRVPSLTVPDPDHVSQADDLLSYEAVRLLADRAAAVDSGFVITSDNARAVADVCRRLDGIPLAIELAAARLTVLSIEQISARLDDRFRLLTRNDRTPITRQRTLAATIDWSHDLLPDAERRLLRRLSAFAGGWTLGAAEHVCGGDGIEPEDILDLLTRLVDKSLVVVDADLDGDYRYRCLESVRHYGRERLEQAGEGDSVRTRHFGFFLGLARDAEPELVKEKQLFWLERLQAEHANLRAALEWQLASTSPGPDSLELATALHWFWLKRAHLAEGQQFLERALAAGGVAPVRRRARALLALGTIVFFRGDFERAEGLLGDSAALARNSSDIATAATAIGFLTLAALERGDFVSAAQRATESAAAARASGEPWLEAFSLSYFAYEALFAGDVARAGHLHEQALALGRTQGDLWGIAIVLYDLALLRVVQQRYPEARSLCGEGIALGQHFGDRRAIAWCLGLLAGADAAERRFERAARLRGAMEGLLDGIGAPVQPTFNIWIRDRLFTVAEDELGPDAHRLALESGRAMSLPQALEYAKE